MSNKNDPLKPLFCSAEDWHNNACINYVHDPLELFASAYKEAADALVEKVISTSRDQDILVYPIVFLYRQYLELRLKEIIKHCRIFLDENPDFPKHHKINELWITVKELVTQIRNDEESLPEPNLTEHVINEFTSYDPDSFSFRYPTDKKGNNPLNGMKHINIRHLSDMIQEASEYLELVSTGISVYNDYKKDMLSDI